MFRRRLWVVFALLLCVGVTPAWWAGRRWAADAVVSRDPSSPVPSGTVPSPHSSDYHWVLTELSPDLSGRGEGYSVMPSASVAEFGEVFAGLTLRARFRLDRPPGGPPVRFGRLMAGCDCLGAELSSRMAGSDEGVWLTLTLHSAGLDGPVEYAAHSELIEPVGVLVTAGLKAELIAPPADLLTQPPVFYWPDGTPDAVGGSAAVAEAVFMNLSHSPVRVVSVEADGAGFVVETEAPLALAAGSSRVIRVRRTGSGGPPPEGVVVIRTDRVDAPPLRIPVRAGAAGVGERK